TFWPLQFRNCDVWFLRPARVLLDRSDPLHYFDDTAFQDRFRMYKEHALEIISLGRPLSSSLQVLLTLRFLACGTFHRETGDLCGASEATVCRIVHKVCRAICELWSVIGYIDGCHVPIKCPSSPDAEEYRNCKNWCSINVQGVCTPNLEFANIVHSELLLGDSGYGQSNFLFTTYINPTTVEHMVERMFGIWKSRFQCLRNTLRFSPRRCCKVIIATAVLHNYLKQRCCPDPPMEDYDEADVAVAEAANGQRGLAHRAAFTLQHFS
uniref:DDE Tnp4 domain-containing protein n=1 Tax=Paramormyrops kingsleyae TaxID=1676925 RepID=A0A3B3SH91_9TELE